MGTKADDMTVPGVEIAVEWPFVVVVVVAVEEEDVSAGGRRVVVASSVSFMFITSFFLHFFYFLMCVPSVAFCCLCEGNVCVRYIDGHIYLGLALGVQWILI
jgi:hypothetical protein